MYIVEYTFDEIPTSYRTIFETCNAFSKHSDTSSKDFNDFW